MDVLSAMLRAAEHAGVLSDLTPLGLSSRVSLYADDVVIFAKATVPDLQVVWAVPGCFGAASGLKANPAKSTAAPIQCSEDLLAVVAPSLPCPLGLLPCSYLGLPLSIRKPRKAELQTLLDKLAAKLPFWKARLMTREGRLVYIQAVMTASVVYHLLALDMDPWFIKAVDKLRRGFFWAGREDARGDVRVSGEARALFDASVRIEVGSGASILLWEDAWIGGLTAATIAPDLLSLVRVSVRRRRSVQEGLAGNAWTADITGELSVEAVIQYLRLWAAIAQVPRSGAEEDRFGWKWRGDGQFSSKSAYRVLWHGTCGLPGATLVWDSFAPLQYKLHAWLALRRHCWTADRRRRRGLPTHTLCPLCNVVDETLDHLSLHYVYAHGVWSGLEARLGLPDIVPMGVEGIKDWWLQAALRFPPAGRKKANSLIMLTLRMLWLERNARVFDGKTAPVDVTLRLVLEEWRVGVSVEVGGLEMYTSLACFRRPVWVVALFRLYGTSWSASYA
ncbi:uncharacterized protein [Lolium perenne]|uniref:uncharacterized protein n=1 Tax=Lolium perenne TaxID=4522 RepID=UPI003A9908C6